MYSRMFFINVRRPETKWDKLKRILEKVLRFALIGAAVVTIITALSTAASGENLKMTEAIEPTETELIILNETAPEAAPVIHSVPATIYKTEPYFSLTDQERDLVERVVMTEAEGEGKDGQMLVAQCILNACRLDGIRPGEAIIKYQYAAERKDPSDSVREAVAAVFDDGEKITEEPILFFYAPDRCKSKWHESQRFVLEHKNHRFFALNGEGEET